MRRALTVLQVLPALDAGGVERSTLEIATALVRAGHRALVASEGGRMLPALLAAGARHVRMPLGRKAPWVLVQVAALRALLLTERVDIVHARSRLPAWIARLAIASLPAARRPRFVTTVHGLNSPSRYSAVMTRGERVICVSASVCEHLRVHYPALQPARIALIPRGIDPLAFPRILDAALDTRTRLGRHQPALAGDGPLLLMPGRGTRLKGHHDALRLLAGLRADGHDARLWLLGAVQPGRARYVAELQAEVQRLGLAGVVAITPPVTAMSEAYAAADLVLQLSRKPEAFGRTVLESLAVGRPVLGWAHGGVGELLAELQPLGAIAPFDERALRGAAHAMLAQPPPLPDTIPYTLQAMQDATLALYAELADGRR
jgi:glycosyltransferase involved in cell wall biosynthesis